jgi:hypothetical protein
VTAGSFSTPRRPVVVLLDGSSAEVRGKAESPSSGDALLPKERARVAVERLISPFFLF